MDIKTACIQWLRRFGMIHGFYMMAVWIVCLVVMPDMTVDVQFLGNMILITLTGSLPGFIYLSKNELTERQWWIRTVIHYLLLNILLLPMTHAFALWQDVRGMLIYAAIILITDICVHVVMFGLDWIAAREINRQIAKQRQQKSRENDPCK